MLQRADCESTPAEPIAEAAVSKHLPAVAAHADRREDRPPLKAPRVLKQSERQEAQKYTAKGANSGDRDSTAGIPFTIAAAFARSNSIFSCEKKSTRKEKEFSPLKDNTADDGVAMNGVEAFVTPTRASTPPSKATVSSEGRGGSGSGGGFSIMQRSNRDAATAAYAEPADGQDNKEENMMSDMVGRGQITTDNEAIAIGVTGTTTTTATAAINNPSVAAGGTAKGKKGSSGGAAPAAPTPSPAHPMLDKYLQQLAEVLADAEASSTDEERQDRRMGLKEAAESAAAAPASVETSDGSEGNVTENVRLCCTYRSACPLGLCEREIGFSSPGAVGERTIESHASSIVCYS